MKLRNFSRILLFAFVVMCIAPSCVKEGPMGPAGADGANGAAGADANETCKMCHNPTSVDLISTQFQLSKHKYGEAAFEEAGNTSCTPCHAQEAFKYVVKNNVPATYKLNETTGKWSNQYATIPSAAYGEIGCSTCHSAIHTTYGSADMAFTTVAPVSMTMWGGAPAKTIDLKADGGVSNLCVKCHQPRPQQNLQTNNVQDYASLVANPTTLAYNADDDKAKTNIIRPSYRMHIHYGSVGAIYAGMGGVEFGSGYTNSPHTSVASCTDCHMGEVNGRAGGHTFVAKGNFNGCNVSGCHSAAPISGSTTSKYWKETRDEVKGLLDQLAAKLSVNGVDMLNRNPDAEHNLWAGLTKNNYDGYLNVLDMQNNAIGRENNASQFQNPAPPAAPNAYWSQADLDYNKTLPKLSLTNAQYGALLNFQLCLREYSLGIHNTAYTKTLLKNSIAALP